MNGTRKKNSPSKRPSAFNNDEHLFITLYFGGTTTLVAKKKKLHSLNVMILCLLNGVIVYVSKYNRVPNDQSHWNKLGLRMLFERKGFGIFGDGGFHFNRKIGKTKIIGFTPYKKKKEDHAFTDDKKK